MCALGVLLAVACSPALDALALGEATARSLGVPLHAVPTSWPLYIVEFKAGRTDLFYCTDLTQDIRVGDLVIVEADRGKDLGKVVNDTITLAEVEAFQKQQKLMSMGHADVHGVPTSPTGAAGGGVKDINPKMIYGKAQHRDTQYVVLCLRPRCGGDVLMHVWQESRGENAGRSEST